jgi:hypothetical protein
MKTIIITIGIFLANVTLSQTKNVVTICDTSKKNVSARLINSSQGIETFEILNFSIKVKEKKYGINLVLKSEYDEFTIQKTEPITFTMDDDSTLIYFPKEDALHKVGDEFNRNEYFLSLEGNYDDEHWRMLTKKRIKEVNLCCKFYSMGAVFGPFKFVLYPEDGEDLLAKIKCYATTIK